LGISITLQHQRAIAGLNRVGIAGVPAIVHEFNQRSAGRKLGCDRGGGRLVGAHLAHQAERFGPKFLFLANRPAKRRDGRRGALLLQRLGHQFVHLPLDRRQLRRQAAHFGVGARDQRGLQPRLVFQ
jgi:hypothetical protein